VEWIGWGGVDRVGWGGLGTAAAFLLGVGSLGALPRPGAPLLGMHRLRFFPACVGVTRLETRPPLRGGIGGSKAAAAPSSQSRASFTCASRSVAASRALEGAAAALASLDTKLGAEEAAADGTPPNPTKPEFGEGIAAGCVW
jgi:hypothetical protein